MLLVLNYGAGKALSLAFENYSSVIVKKKPSEKGSQRYPYPLNPSLNKTSFLDGKQQRHFGKVIKQIAENGLAAANVRVPKEF